MSEVSQRQGVRGRGVGVLGFVRSFAGSRVPLWEVTWPMKSPLVAFE